MEGKANRSAVVLPIEFCCKMCDGVTFIFFLLHIVECKDKEREAKSGMCKSWAKSDFCKKAKSVMETYCPKECGFCSKLLFTLQNIIILAPLVTLLVPRLLLVRGEGDTIIRVV